MSPLVLRVTLRREYTGVIYLFGRVLSLSSTPRVSSTWLSGGYPNAFTYENRVQGSPRLEVRVEERLRIGNCPQDIRRCQVKKCSLLGWFCEQRRSVWKALAYHNRCQGRTNTVLEPGTVEKSFVRVISPLLNIYPASGLFRFSLRLPP